MAGKVRLRDMANYFLYVLSSRHHRHLNIGVTADLCHGVRSQRALVNRRLKKKRVLQKLVYIESISDLDEAVGREIELKRAPRSRLNQMIESVNPCWDSISLRELESTGFTSR